jgi:hypothetical protein
MFILFSYLNNCYVDMEKFDNIIDLSVAVAQQAKSGIANSWEQRLKGLEYHYEGLLNQDGRCVTWKRMNNPDR